MQIHRPFRWRWQQLRQWSGSVCRKTQIILSQAASYVAGAPKSNAACNAIFDAMAAVKSTTTTVPVHLQDKHYGGAEKLGHGIGYKYAHDYPEHYVKQQYLPDELVGRDHSTIPRTLVMRR